MLAPQRRGFPSSGLLWAVAVAGLAAATAARTKATEKGGALVGITCQDFTAGCSARPRIVEVKPRIIMFGVKRRVHVRICKRTLKDWTRGRRRNSAAKKRFLVRPDGTIWRRQPGLRHLKSKKTPAKLKRLKKMVRITKDEYKRVERLLGFRPKSPKAADYIMQKFNEARLTKGLGLSDRGTGTALFV